jgi:NAD(P)-dependent dehydrogenase (short-subunit alcohol dehydrogenase family)
MRVAARTQFANDLLAVELSERHRGTSVAATCVFPGVVRTDAFRNGVGVPRRLGAVLAAVAGRVGLPPAEAAETPAWLANSADAAAVSASFFGPHRAVRRIPDRARRPERRRGLWDVSEGLATPWLAGVPADR